VKLEDDSEEPSRSARKAAPAGRSAGKAAPAEELRAEETVESKSTVHSKKAVDSEKTSLREVKEEADESMSDAAGKPGSQSGREAAGDDDWATAEENAAKKKIPGFAEDWRFKSKENLEATKAGTAAASARSTGWSSSSWQEQEGGTWRGGGQSQGDYYRGGYAQRRGVYSQRGGGGSSWRGSQGSDESTGYQSWKRHRYDENSDQQSVTFSAQDGSGWGDHSWGENSGWMAEEAVEPVVTNPAHLPITQEERSKIAEWIDLYMKETSNRERPFSFTRLENRRE